MSRSTRSTRVLAAALSVLLGGIQAAPLRADEYVGKAFRVTGATTQRGLRVERIQLREAEPESNRGQVVGSAATVDVGAKTFAIGPVQVSWNDRTEWRDLGADALATRLVKVSGRTDGTGRIIARVIEPNTSRGWRQGDVQLTGTVTDSEANGDGTRMLSIFGVPAELARAGYNRVESLTRRQDARRPEHPFTVAFLGRPLRITGEYDATLRDRRNYSLDDRTNPNIRDDLVQELQLELFWKYSDNAYVFVEGKAFHEDEFRRTRGDGVSSAYVQRGLTWLFLDGFAGNRVGLQVGRQNVREFREWWWDADLDAARIYFDEGPVHAELGVAKDSARLASRDAGIVPEKKGMYRGLASVSWLWASRETLEAFALHQQDVSDATLRGMRVDTAAQDPSDANLTWFGLRALGQRSLDDLGTIRYWADAAWVRGRETFVDFSSAGVAGTPVAHRVSGSALDVGVSWQTPWPSKVALTAGFARASGDRDGNDGVDSGFRQTGLHKNKGRFFGVNRFRYYGEVARPELSNLNVTTLAVGVPFLEASSAELIHHRYWQSVASSTMRDIRIDADLDGRQRDLGHEWNLVLGFRDLRQVDIIVTAGLFRAASAYGAFAGRTARLLAAEVVIFF